MRQQFTIHFDSELVTSDRLKFLHRRSTRVWNSPRWDAATGGELFFGVRVKAFVILRKWSVVVVRFLTSFGNLRKSSYHFECSLDEKRKFSFFSYSSRALFFHWNMIFLRRVFFMMESEESSNLRKFIHAQHSLLSFSLRFPHCCELFGIWRVFVVPHLDAPCALCAMQFAWAWRKNRKRKWWQKRSKSYRKCDVNGMKWNQPKSFDISQHFEKKKI